MHIEIDEGISHDHNHQKRNSLNTTFDTNNDMRSIDRPISYADSAPSGSAEMKQRASASALFATSSGPTGGLTTPPVMSQRNSIAFTGGTLDFGVPLFIRKAIDYLRKHGLQTPGIFRIPGNMRRVKALFKIAEEEEDGFEIDESEYKVNDVATALKM
eukprot:Awhi_evm1s7885